MNRPLIYVGPSVSPEQARKIVPDAIIREPAQQSDIISDICELEPSHLLLIDGSFMQNLSVWIKELVYALLYPSLEGRVYGAASMGALRAADLSPWGMIGYGRIFSWYDEGITADDSEVSVAYSVLPSGAYRSVTVPLTDIRATLEDRKELPGTKEDLWLAAKQIHWTLRDEGSLSKAWKISVDALRKLLVRQKKADALGLLKNFRHLRSKSDIQPLNAKNLNPLFFAQFERDRRFPKTKIRQHEMVAHMALSNPEARSIFRDAETRSALLFLADTIGVGFTIEEYNETKGRFLAEKGLSTRESFDAWLAANHIREADIDRLMMEETRLWKLRDSLRVSRMSQRSTQLVIDRLILEGKLGEEIEKARFLENDIEIPPLAPDEDVGELLRTHLERNEMPASGHFGHFMTEFSFESVADLYYSLARCYLDS